MGRDGRRAPTRARWRPSSRSVGSEWAAAVTGNIADPASADAIVAATIERFGRLDLLVNNAAVAHPGPLADQSIEALVEMVDVNVTGTLLVTKAALGALSSQRGRIVNIGSVGGLGASRVSSVYGSTKAAVHHLTTCLARELVSDGITVNTVVPGPVQTEILGEEVLARLSASTLRGRMGRPDEVARWVVTLADPASDWVTGAQLTVDGGFTIGP